jgi:CheY-like chemotaxis protein
MAMKIAILEDNLERQQVMRSCLADRFTMYDAEFFGNAGEMIRFLEKHLNETLVISLDHDLDLVPEPNGRTLDPGTGREVADFLAQHNPVCPVIIHTTNSPAAQGMMTVLKDAQWTTRRVIPFDDHQWIIKEWFPTIRRAIVGPIRKTSATKRPRSKTS